MNNFHVEGWRNGWTVKILFHELGSVPNTHIEAHNFIPGHVTLSSSLWRYLHIYGTQTYTKAHTHNKSKTKAWSS